jgi:predicted HD superfamily hydrolase involved in NAD metabolism
MNELNLMERIKSELSEERYLHSIGAMESAAELALKNGVDVHKVRIAALLHDCAKELPLCDMLNKAHKYKVAIDDVSMRETVLIHGPLGAKIVEHEYCISDQEILDAIECHTTGKKNMTKLDKIIYISDYIEPYRDFDGVEELRRMAMEDLDAALRFALDFTISDLLDTGRLIHPRTLEARNYMLVHVDKAGSLDIIKP